MTEKQISLYEQWSNVYDADEEFAQLCYQHMNLIEQNPVRQSLDSITCRICDVLQPFTADADLMRILDAMIMVTYHPMAEKWFAPRNDHEIANTRTVCRMIYHLSTHRFLLNVRFGEHAISLDTLAQILASAQVFGTEKYTFSTLKSYFSRPARQKNFEVFCSSIPLCNFLRLQKRQYRQ